MKLVDTPVVDGHRHRRPGQYTVPSSGAALMNATIVQWRYGLTYGQNLFQNTAANIDSWRLR